MKTLDLKSAIRNTRIKDTTKRTFLLFCVQKARTYTDAPSKLKNETLLNHYDMITSESICYISNMSKLITFNNFQAVSDCAHMTFSGVNKSKNFILDLLFHVFCTAKCHKTIPFYTLLTFITFHIFVNENLFFF